MLAFLFAIVSAQFQLGYQSLSTICSSSYYPICQVVRSCYPGYNCNYGALGYRMCSYDYSGNPYCRNIMSQCQMYPGSCAMTRREWVIPPNGHTYNWARSICQYYPTAYGCQQFQNCRLGYCNTMQMYSNICSYRPDLPQCGGWNSFCQNGWQSSPYCTFQGRSWNNVGWNTNNQWNQQTNMWNNMNQNWNQGWGQGIQGLPFNKALTTSAIGNLLAIAPMLL